MKKLILGLKKDRQVYGFVVLGLILIVFPVRISGAMPYILGFGSLMYAVINIIISLRFPDARTSLGDGVIKGVTGIVILFLKAESISVLGVIWAVMSLHEVADEIDEYRETKEFSLISTISIVISLILAAMLMTDPFEHFSTHVRILGLEMITSAFIRRKRGIPE